MTEKEMLYWLENGAPAICLSAQKWRDLREEIFECVELGVKLDTIKYGSANCALCKMYDKERCVGCIIKKSISVAGCHTTPFTQFYRNARENKTAMLLAITEAEIAMLNYLEELEYPNMRPRDMREEEINGHDMHFIVDVVEKEDV